MKTAGLFSKNGLKWQSAGFTEFNHAYGAWQHDIYPDLYFVGGSSFFVKLGKAGEYVPFVYVRGSGLHQGEPARSLETAKKRALALAVKHKVLFEVRMVKLQDCPPKLLTVS